MSTSWHGSDRLTDWLTCWHTTWSINCFSTCLLITFETLASIGKKKKKQLQWMNVWINHVPRHGKTVLCPQQVQEKLDFQPFKNSWKAVWLFVLDDLHRPPDIIIIINNNNKSKKALTHVGSQYQETKNFRRRCRLTAYLFSCLNRANSLP